jgi:hypothetical protein
MTQHQVAEKEVFIPVTPSKKTRFGAMVSYAIPGFVLMLSVTSANPLILLDYLLNGFCFTAGFLVVFFSIREFMYPGKGKKPGFDTVAVFTGLLVIAQGAQIFNALKGFQPAHLYFIAGFIFIFKGVMLPESKIKRGYIISEHQIIYKRSLIRPTVKLARKNISDIYRKDNTINFSYNDGTTRVINMQGKTGLDEIVSSLQKEVVATGI